MRSIFRGTIRRLATIGLETVIVNWAYRNRKTIMTRLGRSAPPEPDTSRPVGDRFVGAKADRASAPLEAAVANEAAPLTSSVVTREEHSISQVRIDAASAGSLYVRP